MYGYCTQLIQRLQEFKDVKERIEGLKPQLDRLKQNIATTTIDGDPEETERRSELIRYARQLLTPPALVDGFRSALEEVEKRSKELPAKATAARFVDKREDSGEVGRLVERLREVITHYQVSNRSFVASSIAHRREDITTASNLRQNHRPHREHSLLRLHPVH